MNFSNVLVCVPNLHSIHPELVRVLNYWTRNYNTSLYHPAGLTPVSYARNRCVSAFLDTICQWLLFVDSDTIPPQEALLKLLSPQVSFITGITKTVKRDSNDGLLKTVAMTLRYSEEKKGYMEYIGHEVETIDRCGLSCCLINRHVFESINPPWFRMRDWDGDDYGGEDFYFCELMAEAQIVMHAHYDVVCRHYVTIPV